MANLFAPETSSIGASSMSGGLAAPSPVDYSALFKSVSEFIPEPQKITESDLKANDRLELNKLLERNRAEENTTKRAIGFKRINQQASMNFPYLSREEINSTMSAYTNELPLGGKTDVEIASAGVDRWLTEDPMAPTTYAINSAKAKGDPDLLLQYNLASMADKAKKDAEYTAIKQQAERSTLTRQQKTQTFVETSLQDASKLVFDLYTHTDALLEQQGLKNLKGEELSSRLSSLTQQQEDTFVMAKIAELAKDGYALSKEQEDQIRAPFKSLRSTFDTQTEAQKKALTAQNVADTARVMSLLDPVARITMDSPEGKTLLVEMNKDSIAAQFADLGNKAKGMFDPASINTNNAGDIDMSVEGSADSPSTIKKRLANVFPKGSVTSAMNTDPTTKKSVIDILKRDMNNPSVIDGYSETTLNGTMKSFMYGYLYSMPEIDTQGQFISKEGVATMFGTKALSYAEKLAKKVPANAGDMWNKINVSSRENAGRLLYTLKNNLNIVNQKFMGPEFLNPFVFNMDDSGNIQGSINPEVVQKNSYIRSSLLNYDVSDPKGVDQGTFWKVFRDYVSFSDQANANAILDNIQSLQILAKVSLKLPSGISNNTALNTIKTGLTDFTNVPTSLENMTPSQIQSFAPTSQSTPGRQFNFKGR
jgi:hypothetical protein